MTLKGKTIPVEERVRVYSIWSKINIHDDYINVSWQDFKESIGLKVKKNKGKTIWLIDNEIKWTWATIKYDFWI